MDTVLLTLGSEEDHHSSNQGLLPPNSGYETDESASSVESFRTCYDGEHRALDS